MKRFISICTAILMLIGMFNISALAEGEITIISPTSQVYTDLTVFEVECEGAEKIIFELDGVKIGETAGEKILEISENNLSVGNHTLRASAIFSDKTAAADELDFNVSKLITVKKKTQDFNSYQKGGEGDVKISHAPQSGKHTTGNATELNPVQGESGEQDDIALHMKMLVDGSVSGNAPYISYNDFKNYGSGIATFKFDMKVDDPQTAEIRLGEMSLWTNKLDSIKDGLFYGTDKAVSDDWMHIELTVNYTENKVRLIVDDDKIYDDTAGSNANFTNEKVTFTLRQSGTRTESTRTGFAIDNIEFSQGYLYGLSQISWVDSTDNRTPYSADMPSDVSKIMLEMSEHLTPSSVTTDTVKIYENGQEKIVSDVSYDVDTKTVTVVPASKFAAGAEIVVSMADTILLKNGNAVGAELMARMKTEVSALTPTSIELKKGSSLLISGAQLQTGDVVSADIILNNTTGIPATMAAIVCVRQNGKLRAAGAFQPENPFTGTQAITVTLPPLATLDAEGDVSVKVMICDGLNTTVPYIAFAEFK